MNLTDYNCKVLKSTKELKGHVWSQILTSKSFWWTYKLKYTSKRKKDEAYKCKILNKEAIEKNFLKSAFHYSDF